MEVGWDLFTFAGYRGYWVQPGTILHSQDIEDIGSQPTWDISPVMTSLHSDTILPQRPFLGLSQISTIFSRLHFFYDRIAISSSREAGVELLIGLLVAAYALRHFSLPNYHFLWIFQDLGPWTSLCLHRVIIPSEVIGVVSMCNTLVYINSHY